MAGATLRIRVMCGAAAAALLVAACSSAPQPTPSPSAAGRSSSIDGPTTRPASSTSRPPRGTATEPLAPRFPKTEAGADAFAREYLAVLSGAYEVGDIGTLEQYSTPECSRCDGWLNYFGEMQANQQHAVGTFIVVRNITTALTGPDQATAVARITVPEAKIVDQSGRTVHVRKAEGNLTATLFLRYDRQWRVVGSRVE